MCNAFHPGAEPSRPTRPKALGFLLFEAVGVPPPSFAPKPIAELDYEDWFKRFMKSVRRNRLEDIKMLLKAGGWCLCVGGEGGGGGSQDRCY